MQGNPHARISKRGAEHNSSHRLYQLEGTQQQYGRLDQAIRTGRFVRNSIIRAWMDKLVKSRNDAYSAIRSS